MKKRHWIIIACLVLFLVLPSVYVFAGSEIAGETPLSACANLTTFGETYNLTQDVNSSATCFRIQNSSIILDCGDYEIEGVSSSGDAINILGGVSDITIRNCNITGVFGNGVDGYGVDNVTVEDSEFRGTSSDAILLRAGTYWVYVLRNNVQDCQKGITLDTTANGDIVEYNTIRNSTTVGLTVYDVTNSNISHNNISLSGTTGIDVYTVTNSNFVNNTVLNSTGDGIHFTDSDDNNISDGEVGDNNLGDTGNKGGIVLATGSDGNTITGVYAHDNKQYGAVAVLSSNNNTINNSNIDDNCGNIRQIYVSASNYTTIQNNNVTNGTGLGIQIAADSLYTTIYNNLINTNGERGIQEYASGISTYTNVTGNVISHNGISFATDGVYFSNAQGVTVADNTFTNNSNYGIVAATNTTITATNNNFVNNSGIGMSGQTNSIINWTVDESVDCTNNNITIANGSLTGATNINAVNCTVSINGEEVSTASVTSPSSGGGPSNDPVFFPSEDRMGEGYEKTIKEKGKVIFSVGGSKHTLTVDDVTEDNVTLTVESEAKVVTLSLNETRKVDLDDNGVYDLEIYLENIIGNSANIIMTTISEEIEVPEEPEEISEPELPEGEEISCESDDIQGKICSRGMRCDGDEVYMVEGVCCLGECKKQVSSFNIILIIIAVIILGVIGYKFLNKKKIKWLR